jgi:hypothetical protein
MPDHENSSFAAKLGAIWCRLMHDTPMWPIHGSYSCRSCLRTYKIAWAARTLFPPVPVPIAEPAPIRHEGHFIEGRAA